MNNELPASEIVAQAILNNAFEAHKKNEEFREYSHEFVENLKRQGERLLSKSVEKRLTVQGVLPEQRTHAKNSPSKLLYLKACPHYVGLEGQNKAAEEGTKLHEYVEKEDQALFDDLDPYSQHLAELYLAEVERIKQDSFNRGAAIVEDHREAKINTPNSGFGSIDRLIIWSDAKSDLIDAKFGGIEVEAAETNPQGIEYALGVFEKYDRQTANVPHVAEITVHFVQPKLGSADSATFKRSDIPKLHLEMQLIIQRAELAQSGSLEAPEPRPTIGVCTWCSKLGKCQKCADVFLQMTKKIPSVVSGIESIPDLRAVGMKNAAEAANYLKVLDIAKNWAEATRKEVTQFAKLNEWELPGFRYITAVSSYQMAAVRDIRPIIDKYLPKGKLDELLEVSWSKLENSVKENSAKGMKNKNAEALKAELEGAMLMAPKDTKSYFKKIA